MLQQFKNGNKENSAIITTEDGYSLVDTLDYSCLLMTTDYCNQTAHRQTKL